MFVRTTSTLLSALHGVLIGEVVVSWNFFHVICMALFDISVPIGWICIYSIKIINLIELYVSLKGTGFVFYIVPIGDI